jgi:hypothetical protein
MGEQGHGGNTRKGSAYCSAVIHPEKQYNDDVVLQFECWREQKIIRTHPAHTEGKLTASDRILSADGTKSSKNFELKIVDSILK